jgi:hypothetical protein
VAAELTTAAERLRGVIEAEGECWGADKIGEAFSTNYKPGEAEAQTAIQGLRDVFASYGTDMVAVADSLQAQDDATAGGLGAP